MGKLTMMPSPPLTDPIWWEPPTRYTPASVQRSPPSKPAAPKEGAEGGTTKAETGSDMRPETRPESNKK
jgi:hypothetical protein